MMRAARIAPYAIALALGSAAATSLAPAFAQPAAPQTQERPSRIEGRIAFLRAELHITNAQASQWDAVANVLRENDRAMRDAFASARRQRDQQMTALERLEQRQKFAELRAASTAKLRTALAPLYASMSDDQKKNADQLLAGPHGRMRHHRI
jgi:LTXXQ motif family protein